ncbi:MAG TPA: patatin-like phospholipase family protein, partial [Actinomycetota bacterium]|nr:patatin-like phospholipase family protein [Actinomycetota bacterium]
MPDGRVSPGVVRSLAASRSFSSLPPEHLRAIASQARLVEVARGRTLIKQGSDGGDVYVVLGGRLRVEVDGDREVLSHLSPGDVIGEIAFMTGAKRAATVRAEIKSRVARFTPTRFAQLLHDYPELEERLAEEAHRRLLDKHLATDLAALFGPLDERTRAAIGSMVEWVALPAGEKLYDAGAPSDDAFVVSFGRVRLTTPDGTSEERGHGQLAGAEALIDHAPRAESAYAIRDSYLVRLPKLAFDVISRRHPGAVTGIARAIVRRHSGAPVRQGDDRVTIAVVPASDSVDVRLVASRVAECLRVYGPTMHVWSARADDALNRAGIAQSGDDAAGLRLTQWLLEAEDANRFVVYEPDRSPTSWTRRTVRQADVVLLVANGRDHAPSMLEGALADLLRGEQRPRTVLAILQPDGVDLPSGTSRWLEHRDVDDVTHIREGSPSDFERLARLASGRPVALVLGGGGARGFAHLGVIRALRDLGIPIDAIGGASIGSIMAIGPASGVEADEMIDITAKRFAKLIDYTLPFVSIIKGRRITRAMHEQLGDHHVEDLWIPYYCITTNLTRATEVTHTRGPIVPLIRSSAAIPGFLPPVRLGEDLHIDGGVLNNVPTDVMRRRFPGATIITVDVSPPVGPRAKAEFGLWVSGSQSLRAKIRRRHGPPGLTETLIASTVVASMRKRDRNVASGLADLWMHLDTRGIGLLDFERVRPTAQKGYDE